jgi:dihydrofolate reductase
MTILSMIVAHADNRVIGKNNDMPWHLPADLAYFKKATLGKPIIMGRKTYESIGRPLPGRKNIVITRDSKYQAQGIDVVHSVADALALVSDVEEVMVIGGGAIYQHCLPKAQRLYITHINADIEGDTYFPEYELKDWQIVVSDVKEADEKNEYQLRFNVYERT